MSQISIGNNILVTGGAGYIGSHACKYLSKMGYYPITYDNLSRGHAEAVQWGPLIEGHLENVPLLRKTIRDFKINAVLHFAAYAYVGESVQNPELYYRNNFVGSLSLFQAMKAEGIKHIVFSSTCATYGYASGKPISEETSQNPINPYGQSKLMIEKVLQDYCLAYDMSAIALRYFNASGADSDGQIGESHFPETHLIPLALAATLENERPLQIFGTDYPTFDGTCIRDYIHVEDLAKAHVLALRRTFTQKKFEAFNLGTGRGVSVKEITSAVEKITGKKVNSILAPRRVGDPDALVASADKANEFLNWKAERSDIENIIKDAYAWFRNKKY